MRVFSIARLSLVISLLLCARARAHEPVVDPTGVSTAPVFLQRIEPAYPEAARTAGLGAVVSLELDVDENGLVTEVREAKQPFADGAPIAMASAGFCPTAAVIGNFVALTGSARSGSFGYDPTTGIATSNALTALGGGPCSEGVASLDSGAQLFLSQSGEGVLQLASGDTVLALPAGDVSVAPAAVAGHYAGIAYDGTKTRAVSASLESNDVAVTGVATALDGSIALELVLMGSGGSPGILTATLGGSAATCIASAGTLACASATASVVLVL